MKNSRLTLILFVGLSLALAACAGESASTEDLATSTTEVHLAEAQTTIPATVEPSPTVPRPTATWVPLITPSPTADGPTHADVPRISVAGAREKADAGEAILVDVRTEATYEGQHIAGAISIPSDQVAQRHAELPTNQLVIFYCA